MNFPEILLVAWLCLVLPSIACAETSPKSDDEHQRLSSRPAEGTMFASDGYRAYFGEPPQPEQGTAYARVWFFPLRSEPHMLMPVPLFLFDNQEEYEKVVRQLLNLGRLMGPSSPFSLPFPTGMRLSQLTSGGGVVRVNLVNVGRPLDDNEMNVAAATLTETLVQYDEIDKLFLTFHNKPWPGMPLGGFVSDPSRIASPGPPRLLMAAGSWNEGEEDPYEVLINFDRPMEVRNIDIRLSDGRLLQGEFFHSLFKMSVVIHPEQPELLKVGTVLKVDWAVTDRKGRTGEGSQELILQRP
jgi:hypothetical protein